MSGRKCADVRISQDRYNKLLGNAKRADNAKRAAERRVKKERDRNRKMQRDFEHRQQAMQAEYRDGLNDLSADIQSLERQQNRRLEEVRLQSAQRLEEVRLQSAQDLAALGRDVNRRIEQQGARFQGALKEQGARFQQALKEHRSEVKGELQAIRDDIRTDRERQRQAAQSQIDDLEKLFQLMRSQRAHERFAPGELDSLEDRFSLCRNNLESGNFQAALANGQERYFEYQELQLRIAERQAEWEAYLAEVRRLAEETAGAMAAAEGATYTFAAQEVEAQVDYWSEGALTEFRNRLDGHLGRLGDPEKLSTEELKQMLDEIAPMEDELSGIVEQAKERLVQSQVRQNIAASILTSFEGTHWELDDSTYEHEDFRKGLHLKLKNPAQEEIVASVTPVETSDGGITSNVEINFFDRLNDERLRQARLKDMHESMHTEGVQVGSFECLDQSEDRPGDQQMRDFERLRLPQTVSASSS